MLNIKTKAALWTSLLLLASAAQAQSKPNILFLFADDLGLVDIHSPLTTQGHGSNYHQTPNIDRLAQEGMSFTQAYSQPNCQPSRAALISGQYPVRAFNDTYNVVSLSRMDQDSVGWPYIAIEPYEQRGDVAQEATSLFEMLQQAGYQTSWFGKNHGTGPISGLSKYYGVDHNYAVSKQFKAKVNGKKKSGQFIALKDDKKGWVLDGPYNQYAQPYTAAYVKENLLPYANGNDPMKLVGKPKHLTDAVGDAVTDYLAQRAQQKQPFVAYVPFHAVHTKIVPRPDLKAKYKKLNSTDKRHTNVDYAAFVEHLDQTVARILDSLKQNGLADNTLVIFTSDNGGVGYVTNNAPLRNAKGSFYEGGLRVPFIVKWPGVTKASSATSEPIHFIDIYPTLAEVVGGQLPAKNVQPLDGESFISLLKGKEKALNRDSLFWHFPGYMDERNQPRSLIHKRIGDKNYKLIFSYLSGQYEMYELSSDLAEATNLLENPTEESQAIAMQMNAELIHWLKENKAPTGHWKVNGQAVSYPAEDMVSYQVPDQTGLKPMKDEDILRPWGKKKKH